MRQNPFRVSALGQSPPEHRTAVDDRHLMSGSTRRWRCATLLTALVMLAAACTSEAQEPTTGVPAAAQTIMAKPAYQGAHWTYEVADLKSGEVLAANRPDELAYTASTAKLFTIGTVYAALGPDSRLTTPVYATGPVTGGVLNGNLALVASGDLAMGGRNAPEVRIDSSFTASTVDHV